MESPYKKKILERRNSGTARAAAGKGHGGRRKFEITAIAVLCILAATMGYAFIHRMFISPPVESTVIRADSSAQKTGRIQVNIMNATSQRELARTVMEYLRNRGFDVVELGNFTPEPRSFVLGRTGDVRSARNVALALGIADSCVRLEPDSTLFLDASVYIGADYRGLKPWK